MNTNPKDTCAVILAAGRGTRMKAGGVNKVALEIAGQPIIKRIVGKIEKAGINKIFVVVGYAKASVQKALGRTVVYIVQDKQLGTGHAVQVALKKISQNFKNIFVFYGDDTSYDKDILEKLYSRHTQEENSLTFATFEMQDPTGYGRIKRDKSGKIMGIVEEKNATEGEKKIKEINPGCFLFDRNFLENYIDKIQLNPIKKEYYLTDMIEIGLKNDQKVEAVKVANTNWQGINSPEELKKAQNII